jgi:hypothetical protein
MMILFCDPDELDNLSFLNPRVCEGLEALTGADFCLSRLPINPVSNPKWHLEHGTIFVNIKRGYDLVVNHDQAKKFAARGQELGIQPGRMILLGVGQYRDSNGKLTIAGYNEPPSTILYGTYLQCQINSLSRGLTWLTIPSSEHLGEWIECWSKRPTESLVVLTRGTYNWHEDDFWQTVAEPPADSVESILSCGLPDFGPKKALATVQYLADNQLPVTLFNALMVLSTCDIKGKRVFKVPMIGDKTYQQIRRVLYGDRPFGTMNISSIDQKGDFVMGAQATLEQFHALFEEKLKKGIAPKVAYSEAMNVVRSSVHELIPF